MHSLPPARRVATQNRLAHPAAGEPTSDSPSSGSRATCNSPMRSSGSASAFVPGYLIVKLPGAILVER